MYNLSPKSPSLNLSNLYTGGCGGQKLAMIESNAVHRDSLWDSAIASLQCILLVLLVLLVLDCMEAGWPSPTPFPYF